MISIEIGSAKKRLREWNSGGIYYSSLDRIVLVPDTLKNMLEVMTNRAIPIPSLETIGEYSDYYQKASQINFKLEHDSKLEQQEEMGDGIYVLKDMGRLAFIRDNTAVTLQTYDESILEYTRKEGNTYTFANNMWHRVTKLLIQIS